MGSVIELFCEDRGHEQFVGALVKRLAFNIGVSATVRVRSARGGRAKAISEFRAWQRTVKMGATAGVPDILVLVVDGNCSGWNVARRELNEAVDPGLFPRFVVGCPDPHVERWCLADPVAFKTVIGIEAPPDPAKCERQFYKRLLRETFEQAEQPIITDVMEFAPELVEQADLYAAKKNQPSLGAFIDELEASMQAIKH